MGLAPILEIRVIRVNCDNMRGSGQKGTPITQGFDNCEEFEIIDVIIKFSFNERRRVIANGMSFVVVATL